MNNPFPDIRTLKNNVPYGKTHGNQKDDKNTFFVKKSLFMVGRKLELESCMSDLEQIYKLGKNEIILIKGVTGSGKSHFVRRILWQFLESNKDLRTLNISKTPIIFASNQIPISFSSPLNGLRKIVKRIYDIIKSERTTKVPFTWKSDGEKYEFNCDLIGQVFIESESYSYINYINEILETDLRKHFDQNSKFETNFIVTEIPVIDNFFEPRNFKNIERFVCNFFVRLIIAYQQLINENNKERNVLFFPLLFVIEDCNIIDEVSY